MKTLETSIGQETPNKETAKATEMGEKNVRFARDSIDLERLTAAQLAALRREIRIEELSVKIDGSRRELKAFLKEYGELIALRKPAIQLDV